MPADSEDHRTTAGTGPGRRVFRPRRARRVVYFAIVLLVVAFTGGNLLLPWSGRGAWNLGSRVALGLVTAAIVYFLHRLASVRIEADEAGVGVVNIVHRRRLEWAEIVGVRLSADDPWLLLDLSDGEPLAAMGVQKAEGPWAKQQAREFARLVNEHTQTPDH